MSEPERIERDGVVYVPQLWLRSHRDALDTACARIERLEARVAALQAAGAALAAIRPACIGKCNRTYTHRVDDERGFWTESSITFDERWCPPECPKAQQKAALAAWEAVAGGQG